ncbi:ATP-binding cassette sub-family B member 7, mitochondrial [Nosema granulosis]|uniref:ATP-binding cassette sub-family B member 7, mitochondrial n=1 Tax=Nosema granulosis TaxID=83296 RepID=A0A9P6H0L6_9MICR|nr:ATP-binding cassette sub-family B member 7, mitochondrial [Nosema granulosis]
MKDIKNERSVDIVKKIYLRYVFRSPFVRYFCFIIIVSTFMASLLEVYVANSAKELTKEIEKGSNIKNILTLNTAVCLSWIVVSLLNKYIFSIPVQRVYRLATKNAFEACIRMELSRYSRLGSGEIQTVIDRESKAISELIEVSFLNIIPIFFTLSLTSYNISDQLGLTVLLIILSTILLFFVTTIKIVHWRTRIRHDYNVSQQLCSNTLQDSLINHETILSYKKEEYETVKYNNAFSRVENDCNRLWISLSFLFMVNKLVFALQLFVVIIFSNYGWHTGKLSGPNFSLFLATNKILFANLGQLGFFYSRFTQAIMNVKTSFSSLKYEDSGTNTVQRFDKDIIFRDVSFYYDYKMILNNVNFSIKKGEKVAIIGKNGVGKSTIIKMLMKFEPYSGEIYIDGQELRSITDESYRNLISYVPQTSFLFNETVEDNILYGTKDINIEDAHSTCKHIGVHDSITRLEEGYKTRVGDKGSLLSGGERQKILLVRAVLKNSPIFIMDEPTAALDKNSEEDILRFILEQRKESTVIMILHNLELVKLFDKAIHIKNKKIETKIIKDHSFSNILYEDL